MKIGILGTLSKPISESSSGGTEVFCYLLAKGLVKKGHTVYLFASKASFVPGVNVISVSPVIIEEIKQTYFTQKKQEVPPAEKKVIDQSLVARMTLAIKEYESSVDIFHDNTSSAIVGSVSDMLKRPIVTTFHMPPGEFPEYVEVPRLITNPTNSYVSVSRYEQRHVDIPSTLIYNGIDVDSFVVNTEGGKGLMWIGRVSKQTPKGLQEAVLLARATKKELSFAANITDQDYFTTEIQPHISDSIHDCGKILDDQKKNEFLGNARAALFPIQWEEPFGFVFIEAMACGTPLIAYARGSVPEIIEDGVTGFIVNPSETDIRGNWTVKKTGEEGMKEAIERIYAMDETSYRAMRQACRKRVEDHFSVDTMVKGYETLYESLLKKT